MRTPPLRLPMENRFGLLRWDLTPKPSFHALRRLLSTVEAASEPVPSPGGLRFGLEDAGSDVRHILLRSGDDSYSLVLWRGVSVWDQFARTDLTPAPDLLEVVLGQPASLAQRFDPVSSGRERRRWASLAGSWSTSRGLRSCYA